MVRMRRRREETGGRIRGGARLVSAAASIALDVEIGAPPGLLAQDYHSRTRTQTLRLKTWDNLLFCLRRSGLARARRPPEGGWARRREPRRGEERDGMACRLERLASALALALGVDLTLAVELA
jgi:hypothetical protein